MQLFGCISTDLRLVVRLCDDGPTSITQLAAGFGITRQAITKHLRVMQKSDLVRCTRHGRESIWRLDQHRLDDALGRLREFVER